MRAPPWTPRPGPPAASRTPPGRCAPEPGGPAQSHNKGHFGALCPFPGSCLGTKPGSGFWFSLRCEKDVDKVFSRLPELEAWEGRKLLTKNVGAKQRSCMQWTPLCTSAHACEEQDRSLRGWHQPPNPPILPRAPLFSANFHPAPAAGQTF